MARSAGRTKSAGYQLDVVGLADARSAIARNCERFAREPAAATMAADIIITMRRTGTAIQSLMESYAPGVRSLAFEDHHYHGAGVGQKIERSRKATSRASSPCRRAA